jgi:serine phosphatase RsbU (regulator of sigma subunit)/PAS domain-containing protein
VLTSSLDLETTIRQVARLTVPSLADLCVIDLRVEDGTIRDAAVAAIDEDTALTLEELRRRCPLDPDGPHPVARVLASGEAMLLPEMSAELLESFAQGSEHARFMIERDYRSAIVAPLRARARTHGALSVLRLGAHEPYDEQDMQLVRELARRAALAIDNARLFGELQGLERRLEAILANIAEAITVVDREGRTVYANQAAADLLQVPSPDTLTSATPGTIAPRFLILDEQARELDLSMMPSRRLLRGEGAAPLLVRNIVRETGEERWLLVRSSAIPDERSGRVEYVVNVFENITRVKRGQIAESFMAQASRVLASSMDYGETLKRVARLAVPEIADWCLIHLVSEQGEIEQVAAHHSDPERLELAERLQLYYGPKPEDVMGVAEVIRTGTPRVYTDIQPDALAQYARDERHLQMLQSVGATAVVIVPLVSPVRTIGAVTLVSSESLRRLSLGDVALAERLARRAGTAVENARLYTERSRIAHLLQKALLPESLPELAGARVAARYHAAGELNEVGGDFYDVFAHDPDSWVLVIGDVVGKGPRAAGVTALARHTLRAASMSGHSPREMLAMLHRALRGQPAGADLCTVCLVMATFAAPGARLTVALAGHPPPLLVGPAGDVRALGAPGTLLGVFDPISLEEREFEMRQGETLLLYTDGVLDAGREEGWLGEDGLTEMCARLAPLGLDGLLEQIEREALDRAGQSLRDDIALLGLQIVRGATPGT